ncbi:TPA: alkaline phosphatase D family protein [Pseudomonas putida]|nr:alkaline phosphatase D family protein [Pseudomonas putida]
MALVDPRNNDYDVSKLQSASIIGHVTPESARIWVRVYRPGNWTLVWSKKRIIANLATLDGKTLADFLVQFKCRSAQHTFSWDDDLTHTFDLKDLTADTEYFYYLMTDEGDGTDTFRKTEIGCYKTLSFTTATTAAMDFSFGFYSCHDPFNANGSFGAWPLFVERMDAARARFAIGGGDQVYVDSQDSKYFPDVWKWLKDNKDALVSAYSQNGKLDTAKLQQYLVNLYRWYYRVYWKFAHLQDLFSRYPQYMIWDDHEIMDGWGSRTKAERIGLITRYFKRDNEAIDQQLVDAMWFAARTAYFEYAHSHNPKTNVTRRKLEEHPDDCQWDYSFEQCGVPFFVLDLRGHHDVESPAKNHVLLGIEQTERFEDWLKAQGKRNASPLVFVVSPVPFVHWKSFVMTAGSMVPSAKDDVMDEWDHPTNHAERDHLLEVIFKTLDKHGKTLVFISGDVHCAATFRLSHGQYPNASIYQVTSSAISRMPAGQMASSVIARTGTLYGNDAVYFEHLFSHSEDKNFALFKVAADGSASVDLCWAGGTLGETVIKTVRLR